MIIPVVLAGGAGTRLWPLSRQQYPKQFIPLVNSNTLLQETALRVARLNDADDAIVVCNEEYRFMVAEQMREAFLGTSQIILEPEGKNTAPAACLAAIVSKSINPDSLILVLPADHHIEDVEAFLEVVEQSKALAESGNLVTFGIVPQYAETGYGYIQRGSRLDAGPGHEIGCFVEKPDKPTAEKYLKSGDYYWNSGMFLFRADAYLQELEAKNGEMVKVCRQALEKGHRDLDFYRLDADSFSTCPADSIDYAVMEKTENGVVVPMEAGWNDVGSWRALWEIKPKDELENVSVGDVVTHDVHGSYLLSSGRLLAVVGLRDSVVVETADAVMVSPKNRVQDVKNLVDILKKEKRFEAYSHKKVYRPWGMYETIDLENRFQVKRITVKPGAILSLQKHYHRAEHWVVVKGTALVTRGEEKLVLKEDESTYIPLGYMHRLENPGRINLELIEVQTGSYLGEDDIVRFDDAYGREE